MGWGSKNNDKKQSATEALRERLAARFADAQHGEWCRTLVFHQPGSEALGQEWLEAHRTDYGAWTVLRRRESPARLQRDAAGSDSPAVRLEVLQNYDNVGFYEAICKLAEYEASQRMLGFTVAAAPDADELGQAYYKKLAEREGLAFDVENKPHPTIDGRVVTPGTFPKESFENVTAAVERARYEAHKETGRLLRGALARDGFNPAASPDQFTDYLLAYRLLGTLKNIRQALLMGAINGFYSREDMPPDSNGAGLGGWLFADGSRHEDTLKELIEFRLLRRARDMVQAYYPERENKSGQKLKTFADQALDIADFYSHFVMLKRTMTDLNATGETGTVDVEEFYRLLAETEQRLETLGGSEGDKAQIRAALMDQQAESFALPQGLNLLITQFEEICQEMRAARPVEKALSKSPPGLLPRPDSGQNPSKPSGPAPDR